MADYIPARPTVYKGIKMRSRLEAGYAHWLDAFNFEWEYEPGAFAGPAGQYLPDFRLSKVFCAWAAEPATVYVEVKPSSFVEDRAAMERTLRSMTVIWDSEPEAELIIVREGRETANADVGFLRPDRDATPKAYLAIWSRLHDGSLGLFSPAPVGAGPWPDGYWRVG